MSICRKLLAVGMILALLTGLLALGLAEASAPHRAARLLHRQKKDEGGKRKEVEDAKPVKSGVDRLDAEADKQAAPGKPTVDLARAASTTKNPRLKRLYNTLLVEHDELVLKRASGVLVQGSTASGRLRIKPMKDHIANVEDLKSPLSFNLLNEAGEVIKKKVKEKPKPKNKGKNKDKDKDDDKEKEKEVVVDTGPEEETVSPGRIEGIRYYELIAVKLVEDFLQERFTGYTTDSNEYMTRHDQLEAAELVLSHVLRVHQSNRATEARRGDGWDEVEKPLRAQLLKVLLEQMTELAKNNNYNEAFKQARKVLETFTRPGDTKLIAGPVAELLKQALKNSTFTQEQLKEARDRLRFLEEQLPNSDELKPIRETLQGQAKSHLGRARELWEQSKKEDARQAGAGSKLASEASAALKQAEDLWPELTEIRELRVVIDRAYQELMVGVRSLPLYLSPGWACTDSELRGVELLFESLVSLAQDEQGVMYYHPSLAVGRPRVLHLGREFKLPANARWSDGGDLGAGDLRFTVKLLREGRLTGRSPAWGDMLEEVRVGGDPTRVRLPLKQGLIEPLAAMSFKVLPNRTGTRHPADRDFALDPISSGPFQYKGQHSDPQTKRQYASFLASPHYGLRPDKVRLPRIREVQMYPVLDPVRELREKRLDMALDLTSEQAAALRDAGGFEVPMPTAKTANRRIYFLAVNHHSPGLGNADVRVALARAIHREQLLDDTFRKGLGKQVHKALNGPYPAGSWACDPKLVSRTDKGSLDAYDPDLARAKLKEGLAALGRQKLALSLKYPAGDKTLAEAVKKLCEQVGQELEGVVLTPEARPAHDLRVEVEEIRKYDLAYYHHDFVDETFWLMPLLGPNGRGGGENYLSYTGPLVSKIQNADARRDFSQVRDYAHAIHRQFLQEEMPLIPLWQLHPLYAYRKGVVEMPGVVDPQLIFTRVEEWRVVRR